MRAEAGFYTRHVRVEDSPLEPASKLPYAGIVSAELALTPRFGRSRIGPAVAVDTLVANWREQECSDSYGCRFNNDIGGGSAVVAPNAAVGVRWGRRAAPGQGFDLGFGVQPWFNYDMGVAVPRVDLDVFVGNGWTFGVETSRYEALVQVGRAL